MKAREWLISEATKVYDHAVLPIEPGLLVSQVAERYIHVREVLPDTVTIENALDLSTVKYALEIASRRHDIDDDIRERSAELMRRLFASTNASPGGES